MSFEDLFPPQANPGQPACHRCGALVAMDGTQIHYRWHASVDTAATALLPADTKDPR